MKTRGAEEEDAEGCHSYDRPWACSRDPPFTNQGARPTTRSWKSFQLRVVKNKVATTLLRCQTTSSSLRIYSHSYFDTSCDHVLWHHALKTYAGMPLCASCGEQLFVTTGTGASSSLDIDRGLIQDDWWSVETTYPRLEIRHLRDGAVA